MSNINNEVIEGNKLIAEFDGLRLGVADFYGKQGVYECYYDDSGRLADDRNAIPFSSLKYHSSFDWLMPVVQKIIYLGWQFQLNSYRISNDAMFINAEGSRIQNIAWSTPLLATYNVVIDFIKFYNQNK